MKTVILEFEIKRGVVDTVDIEEDAQKIHGHCLDLVRQGKHESCVNYLLPKMTFEWSWRNGDGDPLELFGNADDIFYECTDINTSLKIDEEYGALIVTANCQFAVDGNDDLTIDGLSEWLNENSMYACGYVSAGWSYAGSDGDNVQVVRIDDRSA